MANNTKENPVVVDSTGVIFDRPVKVKTIIVNAGADTWIAVFNSVKKLPNGGTAVASGTINFQAASDVINERTLVASFGDGVMFDGLWALTLTDITNVLIYLA